MYRSGKIYKARIKPTKKLVHSVRVVRVGGVTVVTTIIVDSIFRGRAKWCRRETGHEEGRRRPLNFGSKKEPQKWPRSQHAEKKSSSE